MTPREGIVLKCSDYTDPTGFSVEINDGFDEAHLMMEFSSGDICCGNGCGGLKDIVRIFSEKYSCTYKPMTITYTGLQEHDIDMATLTPTVHYLDIADATCASMRNMGMTEFIKDVLHGLPLRYRLFDLLQDCANWMDDFSEEDKEDALRSSIFPIGCEGMEGLEEEWLERHSKPVSWVDTTVLKVMTSSCDFYIMKYALYDEEIAAIKERANWEEIVAEAD